MKRTHFLATDPKGEIVIVVAGAPQEPRGAHRNKYRDDGEGSSKA